MNTNTQNVCPVCGGPGYHVQGCQLGELREAHGGTIIAQSQAVGRAESAERECKSLHEQLDTIEDVLMRTEAELNTANKAANEYKASYDTLLATSETHAENAILALEQFHKAKEWNAICELELNNLRSIVEDQDQELSALRIMLLELCEKMEAGISGPRETKRARLLLDAIKANQEKK